MPAASLRTLAILAAVLLLVAGCGRKGPPVAPRLEPPAPVEDLAARSRDNRVVLSWTVPRGAGAAPPAGFRVYRARIGPRDCEGCPLLFQNIGRIPLFESDRPPADRPWILTWTDTIAPNFRHVYKVTAYGDGGAAVDSNLVTVRP